MYQKMIKEILKKIGREYMDPRHIEAYMRLEHGCLDGLSREQFENSVRISSSCVQAEGTRKAEELAESYGL
jgi:hypothetical protein